MFNLFHLYHFLCNFADRDRGIRVVADSGVAATSSESCFIGIELSAVLRFLLVRNPDLGVSSGKDRFSAPEGASKTSLAARDLVVRLVAEAGSVVDLVEGRGVYSDIFGALLRCFSFLRT